MSNCSFCKLIADHKSPTWIGRLSISVAIVNLDQIYLGRTLVIFEKHIEDLLNLSDEEREQFTADMVKVAKAIKQAFNADFMNYAILGNVQKHLHWHIIPRYKTEPNFSQPPWPHDRKYLSPEQYREIAAKIKSSLGKEKGRED